MWSSAMRLQSNHIKHILMAGLKKHEALSRRHEVQQLWHPTVTSSKSKFRIILTLRPELKSNCHIISMIYLLNVFRIVTLHDSSITHCMWLYNMVQFFVLALRFMYSLSGLHGVMAWPVVCGITIILASALTSAIPTHTRTQPQCTVERWSQGQSSLQDNRWTKGTRQGECQAREWGWWDGGGGEGWFLKRAVGRWDGGSGRWRKGGGLTLATVQWSDGVRRPPRRWRKG